MPCRIFIGQTQSWQEKADTLIPSDLRGVKQKNVLVLVRLYAGFFFGGGRLGEE